MEAAILQALAKAERPVSVNELPGTKETWGGDVHAVQQHMRVLVQRGKVQRHHSPDGILRYSLAEANSRPRAHMMSPAPMYAPAPNSKQAQMLAMLGTTPVSHGQLVERGPFDNRQVSNLLHHLHLRGFAVRHGQVGSFTWSRAEGTETAQVNASPARSGNTPPTKKTAAPRDRKRDFLAAAEDAQRVLKALEFARSTATDALELYVASTVDAAIYMALKRAAYEAQAALDAYVAGSRP